MKKIKDILGKMLVLLTVLTVWQLAVNNELINSAILPSPTTIWETLFNLFTETSFWINVAVSVQRIFIALILATLFGTLIGLAIGSVKLFQIIFQPLILVTQPIPKIMLYPIFIILFGFGELSRTLYIFLGCFYIIVFSAYQGVSHIDNLLLDAAKSLGASKSMIFFRVILPASLPYIFGGIKSAIGLSLILMFFSETIGTRHGLGYFVMLNWSWLNMPEVFAGIIMTSFIGFIMVFIVEFLENRLFIWKKK